MWGQMTGGKDFVIEERGKDYAGEGKEYFKNGR